MSGLDLSIFLFWAPQITPTPALRGAHRWFSPSGSRWEETRSSWGLLCVQGAGLGVGLRGVMGDVHSRRARWLHEFQWFLSAKAL